MIKQLIMIMNYDYGVLNIRIKPEHSAVNTEILNWKINYQVYHLQCHFSSKIKLSNYTIFSSYLSYIFRGLISAIQNLFSIRSEEMLGAGGGGLFHCCMFS